MYIVEVSGKRAKASSREYRSEKKEHLEHLVKSRKNYKKKRDELKSNKTRNDEKIVYHCDDFSDSNVNFHSM